MKKLLIAFLAMCISAFCIIPFAGCSTSEWIEVQGIICNNNDGSKIIAYSYCAWDITTKEITKAEYDNAPNELHKAPPISQAIPINRTKFIEDTNNLVGKTYYYARHAYHDIFYEKYTCNSYELQYVKIKISGKIIEIDNNGNIEKYSFITNEIIYFND